MTTNKKLTKIIALTIGFVVFVVFAGSMVKVTGSGMGCPDWPKCFGYYIPPMDQSEVIWLTNHDYKEGQMIIHENELLKATADFNSGEHFDQRYWVKYDKHAYSTYNPIHTIIEYVNRLASVLLGFVVLALIFRSFQSKTNKIFNITFAFLTLFLIGFEAWLGRLVVDGVLNPTDISYHMIVAFLIIIVLSFMYVKNKQESIEIPMPSGLRKVQIFAFIYLLLQLILGVVVRQTFDNFADNPRDLWVEMAGIKFLIHRSSSLVYLATIIISYRYLKPLEKSNFVWKNFQWVIIITIIEILSGAIMGYLEVPKALQPIHVILSSMLLVAQGNLFFKSLEKSS